MTQYIELFSNSSEYSIGQHNNLKELTVRGEVDISGNITIDKDIKSTGDISCNTITATTLYGDGSNLTGISSGSTNLNAYSDVSFGNVDISNKLTVINSNAYYQQIGSDIDGEAKDDNSSYYSSVSLSSDGSIVAIGAPYNDGGGNNAGHVRVYQNINSVWTQLGGDIDGDTNYEQFGFTLSLSSDGTRVAIGATKYDQVTFPSTDPNFKKGRVKIYEYDIATNSWIQLGSDIEGEGRDDGSGSSISLSSDGTIVAIGASGNDDNGADSGHVRIYQYANNSWTQLGSDIDGEGPSQRAHVVSLSSDGSIVAIGAHRNNENGTWSGNVRVFKYLNNSWTQIGSDIYGESANDQVGDAGSVSLSSDGTILALGSIYNSDNGSNSGHVRVFQYNSNASSWTQLGSDIDGEAANDYSGKVSLSSDGTTLAIGAHNASDENSNNTGRVKVYRYTNNSWTQLGSNIYGDTQGDQFGYSLSISSDGTKLAVGAWGDDSVVRNSGHVRVYELIQNNVDINNGIISTNKLLLNYSNTSGSGIYDSVGIDYVQDGTRYVRFTDNTTNSETNNASADIRARNLWLDGSQLNVQNIKSVDISNGIIIDSQNIDISGNLAIKGSLGVLDTTTNNINYGTSGQVLTSNGSSALPSWNTLAEPYYFLAKMTANQTISNTTYTDITNLVIDSNATTSNASSDFASNSWTPSTSGVYFISCNVKVFPTGGTSVTAGNISRIIFVFADSANNQIRSGETMNEENADGTDIFGKTLSINGVIYLTAGTTYKLRVWCRRSPSANAQVLYGTSTRTDTFFSAFKLG